MIRCWVAGSLTIILVTASHLFAGDSKPKSHSPPALNKSYKKQLKRGQDPLIDQAWHLDDIGAYEAWKITEGSPESVIAVVDSGVNYNSFELAPNLSLNFKESPDNEIDDDSNGFVDDFLGWDFVRGKNLPWDLAGHGTFVASIAAGVKNNSFGSAGVCPKCGILPVRFSNRDGVGWDEDAYSALRYAVKMKPAVINYSFAGEGYDKEMLSIFEEAERKNIVVVVAAGNDSENIDRTSVYPAKFSLPNMITVAALDSEHKICNSDKCGSNWGKRGVHLGAPGEGIMGMWNDETFEAGNGTSYATPIVAGAVGLIRSIDPSLRAHQVVSIIMKTVTRHEVLSQKVKSGGSLNLARAMECASQPSHPCLD